MRSLFLVSLLRYCITFLLRFFNLRLFHQHHRNIVPHFNPLLSAVSFTGVLQIGHTKISSNSGSIAMRLSPSSSKPSFPCEPPLYQSCSKGSN
jgi:hypothetical protein